MQLGIRQFVRTVAARDFTAACAHGAAFAMTDLQMPKSLSGRIVLRGIAIYQVQDIVWAVNLFGTNAGYVAAGVDPDADDFLARVAFADTNVRIAAAGLYRQAITGLNIALLDIDQQEAAGSPAPDLHVVLENIDGAQDKLADAAGALRLVFDLEYESEK